MEKSNPEINYTAKVAVQFHYNNNDALKIFCNKQQELDFISSFTLYLILIRQNQD